MEQSEPGLKNPTKNEVIVQFQRKKEEHVEEEPDPMTERSSFESFMSRANSKESIEDLLISEFILKCKEKIDILPLLVPRHVTFQELPQKCDGLLYEWVYDEKSPSTVVVTGEGGSGKTSQLIRFTCKLYEDFMDDRLKLTPIYIPLRMVESYLYEISRRDHLHNFLINYLYKQFEESLVALKKDRMDLSSFLSKRDILLVLDGYDELERIKIGNRNVFPSLSMLLSDVHVKKIVIGTRLSVVQADGRIDLSSEEKMRQHLSQFFKYDKTSKVSSEETVMVLNMLPLGKDEVYDYLERFVEFHDLFRSRHDDFSVFQDDGGEVNEGEYKKIFFTIPGLLSLCSNPNMMFMIFKHLPDITAALEAPEEEEEEAEGGKKLELTRLKIFEAVTSSWFKRESDRIIVKIPKKYGIFEKTEIRNVLDIYASNLARKQFERGNLKQSVTREESMDQRLLKGVDKQLRERIKPEILEIIRDGCLVNITGDSFMFFHNSIIEYLAMKNCLEDIRGMGELLIEKGREGRESFFRKAIYEEMGVLQNLAELVKQGLRALGSDFSKSAGEERPLNKLCIVDYLFRIIDLSKQKPKLFSIAASNALSILCHAGVPLSGMNFQGIVARNVLFQEAILDGTDFSRSDLSGSHFIRCLLWNTKFNGTCLRECVFDVISDESARDSSSFLKKTVSESSKFRTISICGTYMAFGSLSKVTILNSKTKELVFKSSLMGSLASIGNHFGANRMVMCHFYDDLLLIGMKKAEIRRGTGNDVYLIDIKSKKFLKKMNCGYTLAKHDQVYEKTSWMVHISLMFDGERKIPGSAPVQILVWLVSDSGKLTVFNLTENVVMGMHSGLEKTDKKKIMSCCCFGGKINVISMKESIFLFNQSAKILYNINLNKGNFVTELHFFNKNILCVREGSTATDNFFLFRITLIDGLVQKQNPGSSPSISELMSTEYDPMSIQHVHVEQLNKIVPYSTLCFSPTKPLYLVDTLEHLEVVNITTKEVVGMMNRRKGLYIFHPIEDYLIFGDRLQEIRYQSGNTGIVEDERLGGNTPSFTNCRVGTNKRCIVGWRDGNLLVILMDRDEVERIPCGEYISMQLIDTCVTDNGDLVTVELKSDGKIMYSNHTSRNAIESLFKIRAFDRHLVESEQKEKSKHGYIFLSASGRKFGVISRAGDVFVWTVNDCGTGWTEEGTVIVKCSKYIPLGLTGKAIGLMIGTVKNLYTRACFGRNEEELAVYNLIKNTVQIWDIPKKKVVEEVSSPLSSDLDEFEAVFSSKGWRGIGFHYEHGIIRFDVEAGQTDVGAEYQYVDGVLRVMHVRKEQIGQKSPKGLELYNAFGISLKNCSLLKKYCRKGKYHPFFGYLVHPAVDVDPSKHLREGDVLMKFKNRNSGLVEASDATQFGYFCDEVITKFLLGKTNKIPHNTYKLIHAAVYVGSGMIIEAVKSGVVSNPITNNGSDYLVFRLRGRREVAETACKFCELILLKQKRMVQKGKDRKKGYDKSGAVCSVFSREKKEDEENWREEYEKILKGDLKMKKKYFCSELVVHAFHLVCSLLGEGRVIDLKASSAHPKILYETLKRSEDDWEYVGNVINTVKKKSEEEEEVEGELEKVNQDLNLGKSRMVVFEEEETEGEDEIDTLGKSSSSLNNIFSWRKNVCIVENYWKSLMKERFLLDKMTSFLDSEKEKQSLTSLQAVIVGIAESREVNFRKVMNVFESSIKRKITLCGVEWRVEYYPHGVDRKRSSSSIYIFCEAEHLTVRANVAVWERKSDGIIQSFHLWDEIFVGDSSTTWGARTFSTCPPGNMINQNIIIQVEINGVYRTGIKKEEKNFKTDRKVGEDKIVRKAKLELARHQNVWTESVSIPFVFNGQGVHCSNPFVMCGLPWRLIVRTKGEKEKSSVYVYTLLKNHVIVVDLFIFCDGCEERYVEAKYNETEKSTGFGNLFFPAATEGRNRWICKIKMYLKNIVCVGEEFLTFTRKHITHDLEELRIAKLDVGKKDLAEFTVSKEKLDGECYVGEQKIILKQHFNCCGIKWCMDVRYCVEKGEFSFWVFKKSDGLVIDMKYSVIFDSLEFTRPFPEWTYRGSNGFGSQGRVSSSLLKRPLKLRLEMETSEVITVEEDIRRLRDNFRKVRISKEWESRKIELTRPLEIIGLDGESFEMCGMKFCPTIDPSGFGDSKKIMVWFGKSIPSLGLIGDYRLTFLTEPRLSLTLEQECGSPMFSFFKRDLRDHLEERTWKLEIEMRFHATWKCQDERVLYI